MMSNETYMNAASIIAETFSKDPNTKTGCIIVNPEGEIVGAGYNQLPSEELSWDDKGWAARHAEVDAIADAFKNRSVDIENIDKYIMYVTLFPCHPCAHLVIASGFKKLYTNCDKYKESGKYLNSETKQLLKKSRVSVNFDLCDIQADLKDQDAYNMLKEYAEKYNPYMLEYFEGGVEL
ncbi:MAG TPA: hypothetical protein DCP90_04825 [Clostridiales bacterium]|nr:MAG: hypothetical protein A2Y22_06440 [Clostridiales bacterium GWD2_32_59]HAN09921.1 hypothetical protein [Clostridiales bacterium]